MFKKLVANSVQAPKTKTQSPDFEQNLSGECEGLFVSSFDREQ